MPAHAYRHLVEEARQLDGSLKKERRTQAAAGLALTIHLITIIDCVTETDNQTTVSIHIGFFFFLLLSSPFDYCVAHVLIILITLFSHCYCKATHASRYKHLCLHG